jgi:hypothetical protein
MSAADALRRIDYLDEHETKALILALAEGEGRRISPGEAESIAQWAHSVIVDAAVLGMILRGEVLPSWSAENDEWVFARKAQR